MGKGGNVERRERGHAVDGPGARTRGVKGGLPPCLRAAQARLALESAGAGGLTLSGGPPRYGTTAWATDPLLLLLGHRGGGLEGTSADR